MFLSTCYGAAVAIFNAQRKPFPVNIVSSHVLKLEQYQHGILCWHLGLVWTKLMLVWMSQIIPTLPSNFYYFTPVLPIKVQ